MQRQILSYQAIDDESGKEVIGIEIRRGIMKEEQMKTDERILFPVIVGILEKGIEK